MRRAALAALLGLILAGGAPGVTAQSRWSWSTSLDTIVGIGDTRYLMELPYEFPTYGVSSELIFPLDTLLEGVTFRGQRSGGGHDGRRDWGFEASVAVSLLAPFGSMKDYDWWIYADIPKRLWSYTESDVTMTWLLFSAAGRVLMASGQWGSLDAVLGYRLQYMDQHANGYNGWHTDEIPPYDDIQDGFFPDSDTGLALTYWVLWNALSAGLGITLRPAPRVSVGAEAALAVAYVADEDDHVLRYKLSTAHGLGLGGYAELWVRYSWGVAEARVRPFLLLSMEAMGLIANTLQTQTYYAGAYAGLTDSGIDHQMTLRQLSMALGFGISY